MSLGSFLQRINILRLNGSTVDTNSGNKSGGTQRVVLATDQPQLTNALKVDGSGFTQPISGSITATIAPNSSINLNQVVGNTADSNSGNKSNGTLRVVLATDQPQLTNALKVDGSAVTQPVSGTVTATQSTATSLKTQAEVYQGGTAVGVGNPLYIQGSISATVGASGKTLKRAIVSLSASGNIIASVSGKVLKVYALSMQATTPSLTGQVLNGNGGSALDQVWNFYNPGDGVMLSSVNPPEYLFKTSQTTALYLSMTGSGTINVAVSYWDDDAS